MVIVVVLFVSPKNFDVRIQCFGGLQFTQTFVFGSQKEKQLRNTLLELK